MRRAGPTKPSAFDRVLAVVAPRAALKRLGARVALTRMTALAGGYDGARRSRRALANWNPYGGSADTDILPDLPTLRAYSRDLARNGALAGGAINTVVTNVVGTGLRAQPAIDREALGLDDEEADRWERAAAREFGLWAGSAEADLGRMLPFAALQDLAFRAVLESGDVLVAKRFVERAGSPYGLKLQLVEADRLANPSLTRDTETLAGGVEVDGHGAPVAYHVMNRHPGEIIKGAAGTTWTRIAAFGPGTGERVVLHLMVALRPGQTRGVPYLAPVIEAFKQIGRYTDAEIMAAVLQACFVTTAEQAEDEEILAEDEAATAESKAIRDYDIGQHLEMQPGEDLKSFLPSRPNQAFDPFLMAVLRQIGVALELPFEVLIKHFTASYSAARAALVEAWKFFRKRRAWLAVQLCQPVYEALIAEAVARGRLDAPGFFDDDAVRAAWLGCDWVGPAPGQIDPTRETEAAADRVNNGFSTIAHETAAITGLDWEAVHRQRAKEKRMRVADGLEIEGVAEGVVARRAEDTQPAGGDREEAEKA